MDSKVGFNPPFHSICGPLDHSGPCGVKQAIFSTHEEQGPILFVMLYAVYGMDINEIINNIFNFQQNLLRLKFSVYSDTFNKRNTRASPFPCVFHKP